TGGSGSGRPSRPPPRGWPPVRRSAGRRGSPTRRGRRGPSPRTGRGRSPRARSPPRRPVGRRNPSSRVCLLGRWVGGRPAEGAGQPQAGAHDHMRRIQTGFAELGGITAIALDGVLSLRKRPVQLEEFLRQAWFITKV